MDPISFRDNPFPIDNDNFAPLPEGWTQQVNLGKLMGYSDVDQDIQDFVIANSDKCTISDHKIVIDEKDIPPELRDRIEGSDLFVVRKEDDFNPLPLSPDDVHGKKNLGKKGA